MLRDGPVLGTGAGTMATSAVVRPLPILVGTLDESRAPDLVVGRTELVERLWCAIRERSVCVTGARHMGKTWALKLAAVKHPDWASPVLLDAGACQTVPELVWRLAQGLGRVGIVPRDWYTRVDQWYAKLSTPDPNGKPAAPWTMVLNGTLQHASVYPGATLPTIILDGFGAFADRLCQSAAHETVRRVLDAVAAFPSDWPRLRCVISGSGELDAALDSVYGGAARSTLHSAFATFEVPPLSHDDAQYLAACLLKGESVPCSDLYEVAEAIATTTGENPFLIHNTIDWMARFQPGMWTPDRVRQVPTALWIESTDPDDTQALDEPLQRSDADQELARAASVLETLALPPEAPASGKARTAQPHPVLTLPPAFVLFKEHSAADERPRQAARPDTSPLTRMWRRIQALSQIKSFTQTAPASFYAAFVNAGQAVEEKDDPPSFVAFTSSETSVSGMGPLAEARKVLLALDGSAPILDIESDETLFERGSSHLERAEFDRALDVFQELARRSRSGAAVEVEAAALLNTAYALARLRRHEEAIGVTDALVRNYGEDCRANVLACVAMALVNKGASLIALGRGNDALTVCRALLACSPPDVDSVFAEAIVSAQFNVAFALSQLGKEEEARTAYAAVADVCRTSRAESMRRLSADAYYNSAVIHLKAGRRVETIEDCEAAIAQDPEHSRAHALRVGSYLQLNLVGESLGAIADAYRVFAPDTLQRAALVAEVLKEALSTPRLLPLILPALREDVPALAAGILLWLRRLMPLDADTAPRIASVERAVRSFGETGAVVVHALDAVRAIRYAALGNLTALETLPEDFKTYLK